jgi:GNAT superfamily N-acetyltransferase
MFIDRELARIFENTHAWRGVHYVEGYRRLHPESDAEVRPIAGGYCLFTRPGSPLCRASGLGVNGPVTPSDIDAVEAFYRERGIVPRIDFGPLVDPSLPAELQKRGYVLSEFFSLLVFPLADFSPAAEPPAGIEIRPSRSDEADLWLNLSAAGFSDGQAPTEADLDILGPNFCAPGALTYLALVDGVPAGTGGAYLHQAGAEMGGASTLPQFRRRGIQRALLEARMQAARQHGCQWAIVATDPGSASQRNVQRAGYELAYTRVVVKKE